ncbi:MAG: FHA domain-containing protein [Leptolyngbya sp. SIO1D8]|nr:FHA domain-containing protein [Leptolyngbya sp. SIO1D8]
MITLSLLHPLNKKPVQHWTFEEESIIRIGRSTENDVVLYSAVVSRQHVELRKTESGWEIVNMGTNGTYLEGKRVSHAPAKDGIIIRLARSGPNIQINIGESSSEAVKALMRLREDTIATQNKESSSNLSKKTDIYASDELSAPLDLDDNTPTSGSLF